MGVSYECPRCGYATGRKSCYQQHLDRKRRCCPIVADVAPTMQNGRHAGDSPTITTTNNTANTINGDRNTMTNTTTNNTTTNNFNNFNISLTCSKELLPRGQEDLSHITEDMWSQLVRIALQNTDLASAILTHWIHFHPMVPQNHNVYVPPRHISGMAATYKPERGNRSKASWKWEPRGEVVSEMLDDRMGDIDMFCSEHPELFPPDVVRLVSAYLPSGQRADQGHSFIMDELATSGSRLVELEQPELVHACPERCKPSPSGVQ